MNNTFFINQYNFVLEGVDYECDPYNGRCYYLEASRSLKRECDGMMVRHRISENEFLKTREKAMKKLSYCYKDIIKKDHEKR